MSKIDINNEIVLMRHSVRRARVQVLRKLVRQSKMLRVKKGDDKQREKYKRKADKLGEELAAMKKIPDDEVTRYSITSERRLAEILNDSKSEADTCVLARLASHKLIKDRVVEFKHKFPNFADHLGPGRKKMYKLKRKAGKMARKEAKLIPEKGENEASESREDDALRSSEEIIKTERKSDDRVTEKKRVNIGAKNSPPKIKPDKLSGITSTSREAAVKSLASFLEEKEDPRSRVGDAVEAGKIVLEKEVDSFFMTEDGAGEYLSVVVPKSKVEEEDGESEIGPSDGNEWQSSARSRNNRFFDKVDGRDDEFRQRNRKDDGFGQRDKFGTRNQPGFGKLDRGKFRSSTGNTEQKEMHPSWAAKRKEQDILKLGFQGKKIVFDDAQDL